MKILQVCQKANDMVSEFDLFEETVRALTLEGHDVTFCVLEGDVDVSAIEQRTHSKVVEMGFDKSDFRGIGIRALKQMYAFVKREQYDLIITHRYKPSYLLMILSLFLKHGRFVSVYHGMFQFKRLGRRLLARVVLNDRWKFVAVSHAVKVDLIASGVAEKHVEVIYNALDSDKMRKNLFSREDARCRLGLQEEDLVIGTIGRVSKVKGHCYLLEAFSTLQVYPHAKLLIIGGGPLEAALWQQAEKLGISERLVITGMVPDAYRLLPGLDYFVMSSLSEGLPIAMLEAICAGLTVVGTRAGGIPELITRDEFIAERQSAGSLAASLKKVLALDAAGLSHYHAELEEKTLSKFSLETYYRKYRQLITDC
ncbi:glycosyltransferase involved in cell wall biosynthesis [Sinobacterium caligoides]|uniref:Glycosyltransferase involved in cell wall biosynthesis n=1 Tax=Sinobacterium caligoides TaxID=933926 RepID=A0A3N2DGA4_9GAMM|nr:glycosyltransferase [Sinobacterium caligoides]ROR98825.1 glycosyltransferase involved in cell wall biosynthesis [Sinobacterium caligoides]